jgi:hypothetical protein
MFQLRDSYFYFFTFKSSILPASNLNPILL